MSDEEPESPQMSPYMAEVVEGKRYFWCSCGKSKNQPFCDGAHKGTDFKPIPFVAETTGTVTLCGCKKTDDGPWCDGSHLLY